MKSNLFATCRHSHPVKASVAVVDLSKEAEVSCPSTTTEVTGYSVKAVSFTRVSALTQLSRLVSRNSAPAPVFQHTMLLNIFPLESSRKEKALSPFTA